MTTKRIVYTRPGGGVSVVTPSPNYIAALIAGGMTEDQAVDVVKAKDVPPGSISVIVTEVASIPADRTFRNAWTRTGPGMPEVNMPLAREIHSGRMSQAIATATARLKLSEQAALFDGRTADAANDNATRTAIEALDLAILATQIANVATPDALKAVWPVELRDFKPF